MVTPRITNQTLNVPELIKAYQEGQKEYIEELYEKGYKISYKIAKQKTCDEEKAENIACVVMESIIPRISTLKKSENYDLYVAKCTAEVVKEILFKENLENQKISLDEYCKMEDSGKVNGYEDTNSAISNKKEAVIQAIRKIVNELEQNKKTIVVMYYYEGRTIQEIADKLNISYKDAVNYLFDAKKTIKEKVLAFQKEEDIKLY